MAKRPAFQFYTGDWRKDPQLRMCAPATRGIWIDLICAMWENEESGEIEGTVEQLARAVGCFPDEMQEALYDLAETGAADVFERDICVTRHAKLIENHAVVTIVNRRMSRGEKAKEGARLRQQRKRNKDAGHGDVTKNSRSLSSSSSSSSTSVTGTDVPVSVRDHEVFEDPGQQVFDAGIEVIKTRCQLPHHTAQTFVVGLCKMYGDLRVNKALSELLTTPHVEPRSWLRAKLNGDPDATSRRDSGKPSAVDRVDAATAERAAARGVAGGTR